MTISVSCPECSKSYAVKDELAGKKIRCKACETVVSIPAAKKPPKKSDDDFLLDDDIFENDDDSFEDDDLPPPPPKKAAPPPKKPEVKKPKKRRVRSQSSGGGTVKAIIGSVLTFVVLLCFGGLKAAMRAGLFRNFSFSTNWTAQEIPGAPGCTVEMPAAPQRKSDPRGTPLIFAEVSSFACSAASEPITPELDMVFTNLAMHQRTLEQGMRIIMPQAKLQSSRLLTANGSPAIEFLFTLEKLNIYKRCFISGNRAITLDFITRNNSSPPEMERYFSSFKGPASNLNSGPPMQQDQIAQQAPPMVPPAQFPKPQNSPPVQTPPTTAPPTMSPEAAANDQRKVWKYTNAPKIFPGQKATSGSFVSKGSGWWEEEREGESTINWDETARTAEYVELWRNRGELTVRLYADKSTYRTNGMSTFKTMYPGKWD